MASTNISLEGVLIEYDTLHAKIRVILGDVVQEITFVHGSQLWSFYRPLDHVRVTVGIVENAVIVAQKEPVVTVPNSAESVLEFLTRLWDPTAETQPNTLAEKANRDRNFRLSSHRQQSLMKWAKTLNDQQPLEAIDDLACRFGLIQVSSARDHEQIRDLVQDNTELLSICGDHAVVSDYTLDRVTKLVTRIPKKSLMFLKQWLEERIARQFYLLGLCIKRSSNDDDEGVCVGDMTQCFKMRDYIHQWLDPWSEKKPSLSEVYNCVTQRPLRVPLVPINLAKELNGSHSNPVEDIQRACAVRMLWEQRQKHGHSMMDQGHQLFPTLFVEDAHTAEKNEAYNLYVHHSSIRGPRLCLYSDYIVQSEFCSIIAAARQAAPYSDRALFEALLNESSQSFDAHQRDAILSALSSGVFLLQGVAGAGKTLIVEEITRILLRRCEINAQVVPQSLLLSAFMGTAVQKLSEQVRSLKDLAQKVNQEAVVKACTMHYVLHKTESEMNHVLHAIIDEVSMVTLELFVDFVHKLEDLQVDTFRFIFIGDAAQLPPIDGVSVLHELEKVHAIPRIFLEKSYRTIHEYPSDQITLVASTLRQRSRAQSLLFETRHGYNYMDGDVETFLALIKTKMAHLKTLPNDKRQECLRQMLVLTPKNEDVRWLNTQLQMLLNSHGALVFGKSYRVGDRVMNNQNDYQLDIMNGDMGYIVECREAGAYLVEYNEHHPNLTTVFVSQTELARLCPGQRLVKNSMVEYLGNMMRIDQFVGKSFKVAFDKNPQHPIDLQESLWTYIPQDNDLGSKPVQRAQERFSLCYCVTIYKSQGHEHENVFIHIPAGCTYLSRNSLYVSITRARKNVYVVSDATTLSRISDRDQQYLPSLVSSALLPCALQNILS